MVAEEVVVVEGDVCQLKILVPVQSYWQPELAHQMIRDDRSRILHVHALVEYRLEPGRYQPISVEMIGKLPHEPLVLMGVEPEEAN